MARNFSNKLLLWLLPLLLVAACDVQRSDDEDAKQKSVTTKAHVRCAGRESTYVPHTPTEIMRDSMERGDTLSALELARNSMDDSSTELRSAAIETFKWAGPRALSELTEMINDADEQISSEALTAWELVYGEFDREQARIHAITSSVVRVKSSTAIEVILSKFDDMEPFRAKAALRELSRREAGSAVGEYSFEILKSMN